MDVVNIKSLQLWDLLSKELSLPSNLRTPINLKKGMPYLIHAQLYSILLSIYLRKWYRSKFYPTAPDMKVSGLRLLLVLYYIRLQSFFLSLIVRGKLTEGKGFYTER